MNGLLERQAGSALFWNSLQEVGVNAIYLVRLLILARLLSPEDFGLLAIAMTAIDVFLNVTELGMIPALIQRPVTNNQHYNIAWTAGVVRSLAIFGTLFVISPLITHIFAEPRALEIIRTIAILPIIEASASIRIADLTRDLQFRPLAIAKIGSVIVNAVVSISLASSLGVWALVAGTMAGPAIYTLLSYRLAPYRPHLSFNLNAAKPLISYGRWIFLTSLITVSGGALLRVVISRQFGAAELGLYFLATKLAFLPNEMSAKVVSSVAFPLYASLQANVQRATGVFRGLFIGQLAVFMPALALIIVLAPTLVENILGARWNGTTPLIQLLAIVGLIGLIGDSTVPVLKGFGQPYKFAGLEAAQSLLLILFAWIFAQQFGLLGVALAWFPAIIGTLIAGMVFLNQILPRPFARTEAALLAIIATSIMGAIVSLVIVSIIPGLAGFIAASVLAVIVIVATLLFLDRRFNIGLYTELARAFPQVFALVRFTTSNS